MWDADRQSSRTSVVHDPDFEAITCPAHAYVYRSSMRARGRNSLPQECNSVLKFSVWRCSPVYGGDYFFNYGRINLLQ